MNKKIGADAAREIVNLMEFPSIGVVEIKNDGVRDYVELDSPAGLKDRYNILYSEEDQRLVIGDSYLCSIFEDCFIASSYVAEGQKLPRVNDRSYIKLKTD